MSTTKIRKAGKSNEQPPWNKKEKMLVVGAALGTVATMVILTALGWSFFRETRNMVVSLTDTDMFQTKKGTWGKQQYSAEILRGVRDRKLVPQGGCDKFLVIDVKYKIENQEKLHENLSGISGIISTEITSYRVVINRPCLAGDPDSSLWKWEEIWKNVEVELKKFWG